MANLNTVTFGVVDRKGATSKIQVRLNNMSSAWTVTQLQTMVIAIGNIITPLIKGQITSCTLNLAANVASLTNNNMDDTSDVEEQAIFLYRDEAIPALKGRLSLPTFDEQYVIDGSRLLSDASQVENMITFIESINATPALLGVGVGVIGTEAGENVEVTKAYEYFRASRRGGA